MRLEGFEADRAADQPAPLIARAWQRLLAKTVCAAVVGEALGDKSQAGRSFQDALEGVLTRALDELDARHGSDVTAWRWGDAHVARSEHRPFGRAPVLNRRLWLRSSVGRDTHTVKAMRVALREVKLTGDVFHFDHSASLRAVYDPAHRSQSGVLPSTGQSGIVISPRCRDQLGPWTRGELPPWWPRGAPVACGWCRPRAECGRRAPGAGRATARRGAACARPCRPTRAGPGLRA